MYGFDDVLDLHFIDCLGNGVLKLLQELSSILRNGKARAYIHSSELKTICV